MKIIQFIPQNQIIVDKLGTQRQVMQILGLGDDNKIYQYDFITLEWKLVKQPEQKKPEKILS